MDVKKNLREFILIALGFLVMVTPFVIFDTILGWVEAVLGIAVIIVGAQPLIPKKKGKELA